MKDDKQEAKSPSRDDTVPTSSGDDRRLQISPAVATSRCVPGYASMILDLTDDDTDIPDSSSTTRLEAFASASDLTTHQSLGSSLWASEEKLPPVSTSTSNLKAPPPSHQQENSNKYIDDNPIPKAAKKRSGNEDEKEEIAKKLEPHRAQSRISGKKKSSSISSIDSSGNIHNVEYEKVASMRSRNDDDDRASASMQTPEQYKGVKRGRRPSSTTTFYGDKQGQMQRKMSADGDASAASVEPTTLSRNDGENNAVNVTRPGAFAAAATLTVPRQTPCLHSLNEQMTASSHSAEITLGSISADDRLESMEDGSLRDSDRQSFEEGPPQVVEAFRVEDDPDNNNNNSNSRTDSRDLEESLRRQLIRDAVSAQIVNKIEKRCGGRRLCTFIGIILVSLAVVALSVTLIYRSMNPTEVTTSNNDTSQPPKSNVPQMPNNTTKDGDDQKGLETTASTLQDVLDRGLVRCGAYSEIDDFETTSTSFELMCRAIAAAIFGRDGADKYEMVIVYPASRFMDLQMGKVDVLAQVGTHTMGRDMSEVLTGQGFSFSYPFYHAGIVFSGLPAYKECAERFDSVNGICQDLTICLGTGMPHPPLLSELLPSATIVPVDNPLVAVGLLNAGICNVIVTESVTIKAAGLESLGPSSALNFTIGTDPFTTDPRGFITPGGSTELSDLINSVVKILLTAEVMNITRDNVDTYPFSMDLDPRLKDRIVNIVSTIGNFADVFALGSPVGILDRTGMNALNLPDTSATTSTGLMYSYPFGRVDRFPPPTARSETMEEIQTLGRLRCGILDKPLFANFVDTLGVYFGFDVEYCRALSAALFAGDATLVDFVLLDDETSAFAALDDGSVDVLSGQRVTLTNEFFEPTTGQSYSFSSPTYYGVDGSIWALATRRSDEFWSSFVFWVTMGLVHAEEKGITLSNATKMPAVNLFGDRYIEAFRDCVGAVGNYGDIYDRTLQAIIPRSGRNQLNVSPRGPQQIGYPLL